MQCKACSEIRIALISNLIACDYSFEHITSDLYGKSGMHENKRRTLLQSVPVTQVASRNTCAELANTFRRMYLLRIRENPMIARTKFISTWETCGSNRVDFRIPNIPLSGVEQVETYRRETARRSIEQFENHPNRNTLLKYFENSDEVNDISQESKD